MASKFIKGLTEKLTMLAGDWFVIQPDAEESTAYKIKQSNALVSKLDKSTTEPNTWYVNTNGSDSNVGSANFPFLTIQAAHDAAAGNDIIIIMNATYSMNALVTISRPIYIKGPIQSNTNQSHPSLSGTWTLSAPITFENVEFKGAISSSSIKFVSVFSSVFSQSSFTDRNIHLIIRNSEFEINTSSNLGSLNAEDCKFINAVELQVGSGVILNSVAFEGSITSGVDTVSAVTIKNSSISGSLIIDGNLIKENSTVGGTETVSGTTTNEVQDDVTKLSLTSAASQTINSNVAVVGNTIAFTATPNFAFTNGNVQKMIITANITSLTISNELPSGSYRIFLTENGTGGYTIPTPDATFGDKLDQSGDFITALNDVNIIDIAIDPDGSTFYSIATKTA